MHATRKITDSITWVGGSDRRLALFENLFPVPRSAAYNAYLIMILFSADAFGSFCTLNGNLFNDEVDFDRDWLADARRYYGNIVGKYGRTPHRFWLLSWRSAV